MRDIGALENDRLRRELADVRCMDAGRADVVYDISANLIRQKNKQVWFLRDFCRPELSTSAQAHKRRTENRRS